MRIPRTGYGLRGAVIIVVLAPLLAVLGVGGYFVLTALERQLEARLQEDVELMALTLREPLARSLGRERERSLERALRSASEIGRDFGVYLYDSDGMLIVRNGLRAVERAPSLVDLDVERERTTAEYGSMDGREVYSYFTPLTDAGHAIGMLQVTRDASHIRDYLDALRIKVVAVMFTFCASFVAIILAGYHLAIGRPLQRLADTMARVATGDGEARARLEGPREIRWLAGRFNVMLEGIAERDAVLSRERLLQMRLLSKLRRSEKYALVGRLAGGVAHELGAPLSVVDGHAQRLMRSAPRDSEQHAVLQAVRDAAARMAGIVRQLLAFGRESAATDKRVPVERVVALAAADVRSQSSARGIALEVVAGDPELAIRADENRLREALRHLLLNGLHASTAGGPMRIGWESTAEGVRIFVENPGDPVPVEHREHIFEPFFTTKPPGEGSGLGLAIVKTTAVDHGAEISVYDPPGGGAGFALELPLDNGAAS